MTPGCVPGCVHAILRVIAKRMRHSFYLALGISLVGCSREPITSTSKAASDPPATTTTTPIPAQTPAPCRPDPQLQADLDTCQKRAAEKDKLILALQEENARLQTAQVTTPPISNQAASTASKEFLDAVTRTRGAIDGCHKDALKKNTGLASRTVTLVVDATFAEAGSLKTVVTSPSIGDTFDACFRAVASKWSIAKVNTAMTFRAQITLKP